MDVFNLLDAELDAEDDRSEGWRMQSASVTDVVGGVRIGGSVYELDAGQWTFPYHYHHGVEEWLVVITGEPALRTPEGERSLAPGDTVCFPSGSAGAHAVRGPGRILMLGARRTPSVVVYPDSDKLGTRPPDPSDRLNFPRGAAVDYWHGET